MPSVSNELINKATDRFDLASLESTRGIATIRSAHTV
jgi:hypothetical protein